MARLLDLFCGAGGASEGYRQAGFEVVGVDISPQPNYPFRFIQKNVMDIAHTFIADFDAIHASPPCQAFSTIGKQQSIRHGHKYPDMIARTRALLQASGKFTVIENVKGAPLISPVLLCGTMFPGLKVIRHRLFECNFLLPTLPHPAHPPVHLYDSRRTLRTDPDRDFAAVYGHGQSTLPRASRAMGIDWMTWREITQAIPPAYTRFIGETLLKMVKKAA